MAKRSTQVAPDQSKSDASDQPEGVEAQKPDEKLKSAREKLARMESTQRLCFKHQNDLAKLEAELKALDCYKDYEITQILEPKGARNLPGYLNRDIERQKQFVNHLSVRVKPTAQSHTAALDNERQRGDELSR